MRYIRLEANATGCTNRCRHCYADGSSPFGELMTVAEVRWVVQQFERVLHEYSPRRAVGIRVDVPFEVTAHPNFLELYEYLIAKCANPETSFFLLNSNGWGIARWDNWQEVLGDLKKLGVTGLGAAVHGLDKEHDWFCRRAGAFSDLMEASRRVVAAGMELKLEIHLNKRNLEGIRALIRRLRDLTADRASILWSVSGYFLNERLRALEALRPTEKDLAPALGELLAVYQRELPRSEAAWLSWLNDPDSDLGKLFEAYEPARHTAPRFGSDVGERSFGEFRITPNLDVYERFLSRPSMFHGNLGSDGVEHVWRRILDAELPQMPVPAELAGEFGDAASGRLHDGPSSVYLKCCDAYWRQQGLTRP